MSALLRLLQAQLKGKLKRDEEELEDLLTSNVFGSIEYSQDWRALEQILGQAELLGGDKPAAGLTVKDVKFEFWPPLEYPGCKFSEPDVVLTIIQSEPHETLILVESKFHAPKSCIGDESEASPTDQLAMEWDIVTAMAPEDEANRLMLYVTSDYVLPRVDI